MAHINTMAQIVYFDQNIWIELAKGAWDKQSNSKEHEALGTVIRMVQSGLIQVPLSQTNIYETFKINDPHRRKNLARVQSVISSGSVFRGRRRILSETLTAYLANKNKISRLMPLKLWFLSDLWFEAAGDYSPESYGFPISDSVIELVRHSCGHALMDYLGSSDEETRHTAVQRFSESSAALISQIQSRRLHLAGETLGIRRRVYSARLAIDELDFIFETAQRLGVNWVSVTDIGSSTMREIITEVPILNSERELAIRLEGQSQAITENDLRDMSAFTSVLPLADVVVAEKPFVNLARQANLDKLYNTKLLTSIYELEACL